MTIQMKATEQYFHVGLFIMLYKMALSLSLWMKSWCATIQMKATEQYFHVVLFIMLAYGSRAKINRRSVFFTHQTCNKH